MTQGNKKIYLALFGVVLAGVLSGFILSRIQSSQNSNTSSKTSPDSTKNKESMQFGDFSEKACRDKATGVVEAGGLNGEGTHKLIRDGGPSQTVYLISSSVDLEQFVGKKSQVCGITLRARSVPWLMDVGGLSLVE